MDIGSLSVENLGKLIDLLDELNNVVRDKEDIIKNVAAADLDKMEKAMITKNESNEKASKITIEDLSMSSNINDMKNLASSILDSSCQMDEIDENDKKLNRDLDAIYEREESLKNQIEDLLNENFVTVFIDSFEIDKISPDSCRIINCPKRLKNEISAILPKGMSKKENNTNNNVYENYNKLERRVRQYLNEKNISDDKSLQIVKRPTLEQANENSKEEVVSENMEIKTDENVNSVEIESQDKPTISVDSLETLEKIQENIDNETNQVNTESDNIVPLSSFIGQDSNTENSIISSMDEQIETSEQSNINRTLNVEDGEKFNPDVDRTAKTKKAKLPKIREFTKELRKSIQVQNYKSSLNNMSNETFNMNSFVNQSAA